MKKNVTVIMPTLDIQWIKKSLPNLYAKTKHPFRCIIINDKASDKSKRYLDNWERELTGRNNNWGEARGKIQPQRFTVLYNNEQEGVGKSWNKGVKLAMQNNDLDYIVMLNDDVLFSGMVKYGPHGEEYDYKCWLNELIQYMEDHKDIGIVSPVWFGGGMDYERFLNEERDYCIKNKDVTEEGVQGCFFVLRATMLKDLLQKENKAGKEPHPGLFDEENFKVANWEDIDFSCRVRNAGWKTIMTHSVALYHFGGRTVYSHHTKDYPSFSEQNRIRFFSKWKIPLGVPWTVANSRLIWNGKDIKGRYSNV